MRRRVMGAFLAGTMMASLMPSINAEAAKNDGERTEISYTGYWCQAVRLGRVCNPTGGNPVK